MLADLLPAGGGPRLEFGLLLLQGGALLGGRLCLIARGDDLGKRGLGLGPIRQDGQAATSAATACW